MKESQERGDEIEMSKTDKEDEKTKLSAEEIKDFERRVFERLAGRLEYAVDRNLEIRNLTDAELEEADRVAEKSQTSTSDRDRLRDLAVILRDKTRPKDDAHPRALEICWMWLFELLEVKTEDK